MTLFSSASSTEDLIKNHFNTQNASPSSVDEAVGSAFVTMITSGIMPNKKNTISILEALRKNASDEETKMIYQLLIVSVKSPKSWSLKK
ncbi:hypothetical protein [Nissabacter sp. SGAir0207]|uniref:hypothetical protein n=1 Tax=Nissabacter sp. SGAir0207 TaxID=2126321 RepID=UPI0010F8623D|nr:hypothetical protein [Nissabacter sp. SGAir0207]